MVFYSDFILRLPAFSGREWYLLTHFIKKVCVSLRTLLINISLPIFFDLLSFNTPRVYLLYLSTTPTSVYHTFFWPPHTFFTKCALLAIFAYLGVKCYFCEDLHIQKVCIHNILTSITDLTSHTDKSQNLLLLRIKSQNLLLLRIKSKKILWFDA